MNPASAPYSELLQKFYDQKVKLSLADGTTEVCKIDDIEDEPDGWDEIMFMIKTTDKNINPGVPISKIRFIGIVKSK